MYSALFALSCGAENTTLPSRNAPESTNIDLRLFQLLQVVSSDTIT